MEKIKRVAVRSHKESRAYPKGTGSEKLALFGGNPTLQESLPESNNIGAEELEKVTEVLRSGVLSDYVGRAGDKFLGGKTVKELEGMYKKKFNVKYAVSFNSGTTALDAAVCALGIGPGDEVIVSPYTMSASATAILMNMAISVFADIDIDTYCLNADSVEKVITPYTKAIMIPNIFGGSARYDSILKVAREHGLKVIEDNAQAPGGTYKGRYLGTIGDIGVFSLNFHKTVHAGEGGILVTNNPEYAYRAQLKRNHGEAVLDDLNDNAEFVLGSNYRMTEVHAAIAVEQFKKLEFLNKKRIALADYLTEKLGKIPCIIPAYHLPQSKHVYYVYPFRFDSKKAGISRKAFAEAMAKEGFPLNQGYVKPLYLMPIFKNRKIFPNTNCPFDCGHYKGKVSYKKGICPVTEKLWEEELLITSICRYPLTEKHIDLFVSAIEKVLRHKDELQKL